MVDTRSSYLVLIDGSIGFVLKTVALIKLTRALFFGAGIQGALTKVGVTFLSYLIVIFVDCSLSFIYYAVYLSGWRPSKRLRDFDGRLISTAQIAVKLKNGQGNKFIGF